MHNDQSLIFEQYKKINESNLGPQGIGEGLGNPIVTKLHQSSDYHVPEKECKCKHGVNCHECGECASFAEECEGCDEADISQEFTEMAKQQLFQLHKTSELLHELIDHHAFKPWMASKISRACEDLNAIYNRVDYEATVKSSSDNDDITIIAHEDKI